MCGGTYIRSARWCAMASTQDTYDRHYLRSLRSFASHLSCGIAGGWQLRLQDIPGVDQVRRVLAQVRLDMPKLCRAGLGTDGASVSDQAATGSTRAPAHRPPAGGRARRRGGGQCPFAQATVCNWEIAHAILQRAAPGLTPGGHGTVAGVHPANAPGFLCFRFKRFGVMMWMGRRALGQAYDMEGRIQRHGEPAARCRFGRL